MKQISTAIIGGLAVAAAYAVSADDKVDSESGYYAFYSGQLVVAYKSGFLPVLSGDKKGVYVDSEGEMKRVRYSAECRLIPKFGISNHIVAISDLKYGFDNLRQTQLESRAIADNMQNEVTTDIAVLLKGGGIAGAPPGGLNEEDQAEIDEMREQQADNNAFVKESLENDAYNRGALSDLINVRFNLLPETDLENVYCAMRVRYLMRDRKNSDKYIKAQLVRMNKIGNLDAGRPNKVKFSYPLPEGLVSDKGIELFLFSGDGSPLATNNLGKYLRPLTKEELEIARP